MSDDLGTGEPLIVGGCECLRFGHFVLRQAFSAFSWGESGCLVYLRENVPGVILGSCAGGAHHEGASVCSMSLHLPPAPCSGLPRATVSVRDPHPLPHSLFFAACVPFECCIV